MRRDALVADTIVRGMALDCSFFFEGYQRDVVELLTCAMPLSEYDGAPVQEDREKDPWNKEQVVVEDAVVDEQGGPAPRC